MIGTLTFTLLTLLGPRPEAPPPGLLAVPLSDEETLRALPLTDRAGLDTLPVWARMLAGPMPRTAAAMLALDHAHRVRSPIEPRLRAAMRYVAARANGSPYAQEYALADARRAGLDDARLDALRRDDWSAWTDAERAALDFARKMTVASAALTDDEFAALTRAFGERRAAAMVMLLAYANFQDRLLICLGAEVEPGGPRPAPEVAPSAETQARPPSRPPSRDHAPLPAPTGRDLVPDSPDWAVTDYAYWQRRLQAQRERPTRLPVPSWQETLKHLPPGLIRSGDIVWYQVTLGYAPELGLPFEAVMRSAGAEAAGLYDRLFAGSVFWVVTKAIDCPYCMGHCEMNWEVAGLDAPQIAERSRLLAGDDWSSFPPEQQRAFAFARKLTLTPAAIDAADIETLKADFGPKLALIVAFNASRYNYMTRISNGFQLTLESENVFYDYHGVTPPDRAASAAQAPPFVAVLSDEECWSRLPEAVRGSGQPLPVWARAVAVELPRTAAAMLELDYAQRAKSPLDPALRAKMRWVIAHANRCAYSEAYALADLRRAGADDATIERLTAGPAAWPDDDREPLEFARLLTVAAPTIPDALFASLARRFGDKAAAAMVLLGAYGNFQDRILLGLGLAVEPGGPLPPLDVAFAPGAIRQIPTPLREGPVPDLIEGGAPVVETDPEWSSVSYDELQSRLEHQRARTPRLPIPTWDEVKKNLPEALAKRPVRIVWTLVCLGYAPELAVPWNNATRTLWAEAASDRVLEESLFWIQTRAIGCNYCMGHCEMLLEVAGLDKRQIAERTRRLASGDWSAFPPEEQRAYAFARKLSRTPWELTAEDFKTLERDYGPNRSMALFWWLCRGLYMTRVSDGFQLPLERDNVFQGFFPKADEPGVSTSGGGR
jgi:alkylhydroperoxidase family enzyme